MKEINFNLPRELDFTLEARNAEECRAMLEEVGGEVARVVHVPHVYPRLSSSRVLSMEYVEGVLVGWGGVAQFGKGGAERRKAAVMKPGYYVDKLLSIPCDVKKW